MVVTNLLPVATPFQQRTVDESVLKRKSKLWPNSHVLQSFHYTVAVFGTHCFHHFSVSKSGNRHKYHKLSSPVQPSCCGETNQSLLTTRAKEGQMPHSIVQVLRQYRTCRFEFIQPLKSGISWKKLKCLGFNKPVSLSPWPTQRWLILTAHGNGYCHQWQQRQNRQDGQALSSTDRNPKPAKQFEGDLKVEVWPPKPCAFPYFKKINPFKRNKTKQVFFVVGNPCLWVGHHKTLENQHETKKWSLGRWSSFSTGSFVGSKAIHFGCNDSIIDSWSKILVGPSTDSSIGYIEVNR